jgi:hypothetical protein
MVAYVAPPALIAALALLALICAPFAMPGVM